MTDALIIDACRTPRGIGKQGKGALADMHPQHLAASVLTALAERNIPALIADTAHLQDHVDRGLQVSDHFAETELGALGHHQKRQPVHCLAGRMGVQRGERPRMPSVDRVQKR